MTANLLEDVGQVLGSGSFGWLGRATGESPDVVDRAASAGLPALLGGLSSLGDTPAGAGQIMNLVHGDGLDEPNALARLGAMASHDGADALVEQGRMPLGAIFGSKLEGIIATLGGAANVTRASMGRILSMLTPIALAVIGRHVREDHLDADALSDLLQSQHAFLAGTLPEPVSTTLGLGTLGPRAYAAPVVERRVVEHPIARPIRPVTAVERRASSFWPWAALALLAVLGALFVYRFAERRPRADVTPEVVIPPAEVAAPVELTPEPAVNAPPAAPAPPEVAPPAMAAAKLDPATLATKDIRFAPKSAALPESSASLDGIAAAMKANPAARIRVTGHTDARERDDGLATQRAEAVRDALVARGVGIDRIDVATAPAPPAAQDAKAPAQGGDRRVDVEQVER